MDIHKISLRCMLLMATLLLVAGCSDLSAGPDTSPSPHSTKNGKETHPTQPTKPASPEKTTPSKLVKVSFFSKALGKKMRLNVYLPPGYAANRKYPVLYMLHGYFGTELAWMPEMQLEKAADRLIAEGRIEPLIIVDPELDNSYGLNSADRYRVASPKDPSHSRYYGRYEDYFVQDVLSYMDGTYSTIAAKEGRYVGGYSMGGFVSLHAAFRHPDLFSKVGGHSPALFQDWSRVPLMESWLYPTKAKRKERDPIELAKTQDLSGMSVYLDCGNADDFKLYDGTKKLFDILKSRGVPSEYHLNPGKHNRTYWKSRIDDYLLFYGKKPSVPK
jgi:enterochelin esterase-like enzyme